MSPDLVLKIALWTSLACVAYAYVGYPLLLSVAARWLGRRGLPPVPTEAAEFPTVSLVIAAFNEEKWIGRRIQNALELEYPADRLQIVVASDGSTDRTAAIAADYAVRHSGRVTVHQCTARRGKANVLNEVLPSAAGQIVVLSDANTFFDHSAVRKLTRWFGEEDVVAVCGQLRLVDPASGKNVDGLYWRCENFLKEREARLGALLGANGAVYAIRRESYVPIPGDTIIDDFVIPLLMKLRSHGRIVYDIEAVATEETPPHVRDEFRRRARIGAGGFQSLSRLWPLLLPSQGWTCWTFWSHKVLRWLAPMFLLIALAANLLLLSEPEYRLLLGLQLAFYATALLGMFVPGSGTVPRLLRLTTLFASMNAALAVGFWRWLAGTQQGTWQRTAR